jgi:phosphoribosylanthranilate isomerase
MRRLKIKICGITSLEDAQAALEAGADALGFVFFESSPRKIARDRAAGIIRHLPPFVAKVGVFVDPAEADVRRVVAECGVDTLQFHGQETPEFCQKFLLPTVKAFRIRDRESLRALPAYPTHAWLLDSYVSGQLGGTGERFNWDLAVAAKQWNRPVILAGGLTPDNVAAAVRQVGPYAVDVSSGVEASPGKKDVSKLRAFIAAARAAAE